MGKVKAVFRENIYMRLFLCFFKLGIVTVGGGMAMVPLMQEKICDKQKWMSEEEVLDCIAVSQGLPGVIAINMATYVGYFKKGFWGALMATFGVILPSFVIIILVVCFLEEVGGNPYIGGALEGVKAAATGLIAYAAWKMGKQTLGGAFQWIVAAAAFLAIGIFGVNAVWVILAGILIGEIYFTAGKAKQNRGGQQSPKAEEEENDGIDS